MRTIYMLTQLIKARCAVIKSALIYWGYKHTPFVTMEYNYSTAEHTYLALDCLVNVAFSPELKCGVLIDTYAQNLRSKFFIRLHQKGHKILVDEVSRIPEEYQTKVTFKLPLEEVMKMPSVGTLDLLNAIKFSKRTHLPLKWGGSVAYAMDIHTIKTVFDLPQDFLNSITPYYINYVGENKK